MYATLAARCGFSAATGSTGWLPSSVTEKWSQTKVGVGGGEMGTGERVEERLSHSLTHMSICVYAGVYGCTVCCYVFTVREC